MLIGAIAKNPHSCDSKNKIVSKRSSFVVKQLCQTGSAGEMAYLSARRTGTGMLQISAPPAGTMKNGSRRLARASA